MTNKRGCASQTMSWSQLRALDVGQIRRVVNAQLTPDQVAAAAAFVQDIEEDLQKLAAATTARFNGKGSLTLGWGGREEFGAGVMPVAGHDYLMTINIVAPLTLLSMAHAIWAPPEQMPPGRALSKDAILSGELPPGELQAEARAIAKDASVLLYFHELAHLLWSHCELDLPSQPAQIRRALEHQADYYAAFTFVAVQSAPIGHSNAAVWKTMATRLVRAALLLSTAFKAYSAPSDGYHFPTTRLNAFFGGAFKSIELHTADLQQPLPFADEVAEEDFIRPLATDFLQRLRATPLREFAGLESELDADFADLRAITEPTLESLASQTDSLWKRVFPNEREAT